MTARPVEPNLLPEHPGPPPRGRPPRSMATGDRGEILRTRIILAAAEAFADTGYAASSVEDIIARAGMSRRTFYRIFDNREDVLLDLYREASGRLLEHIAETVDAAGTPLEKLLAGVGAYVDALASHPSLARVFLIDVPAAGPRLAEACEQVHAAFSRRIALGVDAMVAEGRLVQRPNPLMPRALVGAINEVVTHLLAQGRDLRAATPLVLELFARLLGPPLQPSDHGG